MAIERGLKGSQGIWEKPEVGRGRCSDRDAVIIYEVDKNRKIMNKKVQYNRKFKNNVLN